MNDKEVVLVDYGVGNLLSVSRALEHSGARVIRTRNPYKIQQADRIVVPGVGAFGACVERLKQLQLWDALKAFIETGRPYLGICVGMQMMMDASEEFGEYKGLGIIPGRVVLVPATAPDGTPKKIPNIGWCSLSPVKEGQDWSGTILGNVAEGDHFYFVHSFMAEPMHSADRLANINDDGRNICVAVRRGLAFGCQFHPEKSGAAGLSILKRFMAL